MFRSYVRAGQMEPEGSILHNSLQATYLAMRSTRALVVFPNIIAFEVSDLSYSDI